MYFKNRQKYLKLECICGNKFEVSWRKFTRKDAKPKHQCNDCSLKFKKSKNIKEVINGFYILDSYSSEKHKTYYKVRCIYCNKIQDKISTKVLNGNAKCDCQKSHKIRNRDNCRLGNIYKGMLARCENPNKDSYKYYGAKGIKVCDEWQTYNPFKKWAIENGYNDELTIDRKDYTKGYYPENCRWVDYKTQANNKSNNHYITFQGQTKTLEQWSEVYDIKSNTILYRLKRGWDLMSALMTEVK